MPCFIRVHFAEVPVDLRSLPREDRGTAGEDASAPRDTRCCFHGILHYAPVRFFISFNCAASGFAV